MSISYEQTQNMMVIKVFNPRTAFSRKKKENRKKSKEKQDMNQKYPLLRKAIVKQCRRTTVTRHLIHMGRMAI